MDLFHAPILFKIDKLKGKKYSIKLLFYLLYWKKTTEKKGKISLGANLTPNASCQ